jgi:proteasome alpha subunit
MTEPSGQFMPYYAVAIGQGGSVATEYLEKNYKEDLSVEDTILLALRALASTLKPGEKLTSSTVEIGYASTDVGIFRKMSVEERTSILQKL